jgi:hypothetical protein
MGNRDKIFSDKGIHVVFMHLLVIIIVNPTLSSRVNSDPSRFKNRWLYIYFCEKSVNLQSFLMAKAKKPNVNNCLDTSQNKAVSLAGK